MIEAGPVAEIGTDRLVMRGWRQSSYGLACTMPGYCSDTMAGHFPIRGN